MSSEGNRPRCPGQDMRFWKPEDIFTMKCQHCGNEMEFWKDEPFLLCRKCGTEVKNPRIDLGCAKWCKFADQCLGRTASNSAASPVIEKVKELLASRFKLDGESRTQLDMACKLADGILGGTKCDPCIVKTSLALICFAAKEGKRDMAGLTGLLADAGIAPEQQEKISAIVKAILNGQESASEEIEAVRKVLDTSKLVRFVTPS